VKHAEDRLLLLLLTHAAEPKVSLILIGVCGGGFLIGVGGGGFLSGVGGGGGVRSGRGGGKGNVNQVGTADKLVIRQRSQQATGSS
jgi:hypothetical protein